MKHLKPISGFFGGSCPHSPAFPLDAIYGRKYPVRWTTPGPCVQKHNFSPRPKFRSSATLSCSELFAERNNTFVTNYLGL